MTFITRAAALALQCASAGMPAAAHRLRTMAALALPFGSGHGAVDPMRAAMPAASGVRLAMTDNDRSGTVVLAGVVGMR